MKRLIAVLSGLLVLPAFAEIAPQYYYEELMAQYADEMPDSEFIMDESDTVVEEEPAADEVVTPVVPTAVSPRNTNGRAATSRAITSATTSSGRAVAARNVSNATTARTVTTRPSTTTTANTTRCKYCDCIAQCDCTQHWHIAYITRNGNNNGCKSPDNNGAFNRHIRIGHHVTTGADNTRIF